LPQGINFAVHSSIAEEFVRRALSIELQRGTVKTVREVEEVAEMARHFTGLVKCFAYEVSLSTRQ
jgi:hypothetical protein